MALKRREEREILFTMLFEALFHPEREPRELFDAILENADRDDLAQSTYLREGFLGVCTHREEIMACIAASAKGWRPERLSKVSLALLQLAVYEMTFVPDLAKEVAINEAVELSKKYDDDKAPAFINGVLRGVFNALPKDPA
jgi:N utilization substance protein B